METNYKFTNDYFSGNLHNFQTIKKYLGSGRKDLDILEIGCHEGRSTTWIIDNLLDCKDSELTCIDPYLLDDETTPVHEDTQKIFMSNVSKSKYPQKVIFHNSTSHDILPRLIRDDQSYDFIYVDGSHLAADVLFDAVNSWQLLKKTGIILFDDYRGGNNGDPKWMIAKPAILSLMMCMNPKNYKIVINNYQLAIQKI